MSVMEISTLWEEKAHKTHNHIALNQHSPKANNQKQKRKRNEKRDDKIGKERHTTGNQKIENEEEAEVS